MFGSQISSKLCTWSSFKWVTIFLGLSTILFVILPNVPALQPLLADVDSKNLTIESSFASNMTNRQPGLYKTSSALADLEQNVLEVKKENKTASNLTADSLQGEEESNSTDAIAEPRSTECGWRNNGSEWGDQGEFSSLLKQAHNGAPATFAGRSVLVIGGSTSRDLASYFMRMVLPPQQRDEVTRRWDANQTEGYQLFTRIGKGAKSFERMYKPETMCPLMDAGWKFERIDGPEAGCSDCRSSYTNIDYVASLRGGAFGNSSEGVSFEFSWKPDIFAPQADVTGFHNRYCKRRYDVVHISRGLHDAAFKPMEELTPERVRERFLKLAELVQCFPPTTLVVIRTPYLSTKDRKGAGGNEDAIVVDIAEELKDLVRKGAFGSQRSVLIDGHLLTTTRGHPDSFDGHHYKTAVSQAYLNLMTYATNVFFNMSDAFGDFQQELTGKWQQCGLGLSSAQTLNLTSP